ncbi:DUF7282 domain-containing protein [Notoacmeibacter ruber]|uniref:DUF7282 domain-containing protein n=1 Tax=Notoacmeibacter ruber TaxID=2670375 RepID=A0A3L7JAR9_9HYPH|nr:hypothetical protein [Notoacmeibacter ruber]RLQ87838.1 hypothetical protein D8780_06070 [Notoacmeibacter ruber]
MTKTLTATIAIASFAFATPVFAQSDASVSASDQDVSSGTVMAETITAPENGWLVVHRTDSEMAPGPVVGYAPLKAGDNESVVAILQEEVASGDMLMLMVHGETGGNETGVFEYTLGAKEDGPIRINDELVMKVVTAQ